VALVEANWDKWLISLLFQIRTSDLALISPPDPISDLDGCNRSRCVRVSFTTLFLRIYSFFSALYFPCSIHIGSSYRNSALWNVQLGSCWSIELIHYLACIPNCWAWWTEFVNFIQTAAYRKGLAWRYPLPTSQGFIPQPPIASQKVPFNPHSTAPLV